MEDNTDVIIDLKAEPYYPLRNHEIHCNWIDADFDQESKERRQRLQCIENCVDAKQCGYCSLNGEWRNNISPVLFLDDDVNSTKGFFHKYVSMNSELIFIDAYSGDVEKAENRWNCVNEEIDGLDEEHKYLDGYKYIARTLGAYVKFCNGSLDHSDVESLRRYKDLSPQAQVAVLSFKLQFYKVVKNTFEKQAKILKKMTELDPKNPIWHEALGIRLRLLKNQSPNAFKGPSHDEINSFARAYDLRSDVPQFFASYSRCIAEKLKQKRVKTSEQAIQIYIQDQSIETVDDIVSFLKKYTKFLLDALDGVSVSSEGTIKAITTMAEVFSVSLPKRLQDLDFAEECINAAIELGPTCSKTHHRMALFQFRKRRNYEGALYHYSQSVACKKENFFAVVDWIETLLYDVEKRTKALDDLFAEVLAMNVWSISETARLIFLKGCFLFMAKRKKNDILDLWTKAYDVDNVNHFTIAFNEAKRFCWNRFVAQEIFGLLTGSRSTPNINKMIDEVRVVADKAKSKAKC